MSGVRAAESERADTNALRDDGVSFIEMLIAIVLLGTVVIGVLTAVRTTVIATRLERDHSKAQQWLQSAVQVIEDDAFGDCRLSNGIPQSHNDVVTQYQNRLNDGTDGAKPPDGWTGSQLRVVPPLDVWDGSKWIQYTTATDCYDDYGLKLQRITVEVKSPDGQILEMVQAVKSD